MGGEWAPAVTFSIIALSVSAAFVLRGPVGKALAQWIASWSTPEHKAMEAQWAKVAAASAPRAAGTEVAELRDEVDDLRRQLAEVHERLDFAERLLTKSREAERLPPVR
jgi:ubiquinone biosynthesis protein UbiJ